MLQKQQKVYFNFQNGFRNTSNRQSFCTTNDTIGAVNNVRVYNTGYVQLIRTNQNLEDGISVFLDGISFYTD